LATLGSLGIPGLKLHQIHRPVNSGSRVSTWADILRRFENFSHLFVQTQKTDRKNSLASSHGSSWPSWISISWWGTLCLYVNGLTIQNHCWTASPRITCGERVPLFQWSG